jgi:hypothetical protein
MSKAKIQKRDQLRQGVLAFNHLDLICHLGFDICHSNPEHRTSLDYPILTRSLKGLSNET